MPFLTPGHAVRVAHPHIAVDARMTDPQVRRSKCAFPGDDDLRACGETAMPRFYMSCTSLSILVRSVFSSRGLSLAILVSGKDVEIVKMEELIQHPVPDEASESDRSCDFNRFLPQMVVI